MNLNFINIKDGQGYWLVRTYGGEYYQEFSLDGFIGIGWDKFISHELDKSIGDKKAEEDYVDKIRQLYPDELKPRHVFNQIRDFMTNMKAGDFVIIPSKSSTHVSFGRITSDVYISANIRSEKIEEGACPFRKRRNVRWIKTVKRDNLDPYLYRLIYSHHTITEASYYASFIDRTLFSFYAKSNESHLILRVNRQENIPGKDLIRLIDRTINMLDLFNKETGSNYNTDNIDIKINVQSPGPIEFFEAGMAILVLGLILHYIVGGKFEGEITKDSFKIKGDTEGLLEKILKFKKASQEKPEYKVAIEELQKLQEKLQVKITDKD